jgi:hypothetical protein
LEESAAHIFRLTDSALREKTRVYRGILAARAERLNGGARKNLPESFWDESVWEGMSREEMESALVVETLKAHLGKTPLEEVRELVLFPALQRPQQGG